MLHVLFTTTKNIFDNISLVIITIFMIFYGYLGIKLTIVEIKERKEVDKILEEENKN
jgi:hypothetical protein